MDSRNRIEAETATPPSPLWRDPPTAGSRTALVWHFRSIRWLPPFVSRPLDYAGNVPPLYAPDLDISPPMLPNLVFIAFVSEAPLGTERPSWPLNLSKTRLTSLELALNQGRHDVIWIACSHCCQAHAARMSRSCDNSEPLSGEKEPLKALDPMVKASTTGRERPDLYR